MSQTNIDHFNTKLQGTNLDDIPNMDDPQEAFSVFHSSHTNLYSDCFPPPKKKKLDQDKIIANLCLPKDLNRL